MNVMRTLSEFTSEGTRNANVTMTFHYQCLLLAAGTSKSNIHKQVSVCPCFSSMDTKCETNDIYMVIIGPEDGNKLQCFSPFYSVNLCHIKMHLGNYFYTQGSLFSQRHTSKLWMCTRKLYCDFRHSP
jgi:hypothetical protein